MSLDIASLRSGGRTLTLPTSGLTGLWYADRVQSSPRPYVPNDAVITPIAPNNLLAGQRRLFTSALWGKAGSPTVADLAGTGPDGLTEASRISWGSADAYVTQSMALANGTYTLAAEVKRNTGSDQSFRFGDLVSGTYSSLTATASWVTIARTFTVAASTAQVGFRSVDSSTPADLLVSDVRLFPGASDLGADTLIGNMILGSGGLTDKVPAYASGALTFGNSKVAHAAFASAPITSGMTIIAVGSKVTNAGALSAALAALSNSNASLFFENTTADAYFNTHSLANNGVRYANLWKFYQQGWSVFGARYDGTTGDYWLDDTRLFFRATTRTPVADKDFFAGMLSIAGSYFYSDHKIAAIAVYNRALSDDEYRQAYAALAARSATFSNTITPRRILVSEGDSITNGTSVTNGGYVKLFAANADPVCWGFNNAVSGSTISDLNSRATALDSIIPANKGSRKYILTVMVGHNDFVASGDVSAFLASLAAYCDARRAAGWIVVLCTILPTTVANGNSRRNTANATIVTWAGVHADAICDMGADATMGTDAAASDTLLYSDGTHPTNAGHVALEPLLRATVNAI